ncbi:MAG: hypothetical protein ACRBN8_39780 [Nannocystales bacterium]
MAPGPEHRVGELAAVCEPVELDPRLSIFETNPEVLAPFTMRRILRRAALNAGYFPTPRLTYQRMIDTYATGEEGMFPNGQHCDDELPDPAFTNTNEEPCGLLGCDQRFFCAANDTQCFACNGEGTACPNSGLPPGAHAVCAFDGSGEVCTFEGNAVSDCEPVVGDECADAGCHPLGCDAVELCDTEFDLCVMCTGDLDQCEVTQGATDEPIELVCNFTDLCQLDVATGVVSDCQPDPDCEEAACGPLGCQPQFVCTPEFEFCFACTEDGTECDPGSQAVPSPTQVCSFETGEVCTFADGMLADCGPDLEGVCFGGGGDSGGFGTSGSSGFDSAGFISPGTATTPGTASATATGGTGGFDSGGFISGGEVGGSVSTSSFGGGDSFGDTESFGTSGGFFGSSGGFGETFGETFGGGTTGGGGGPGDGSDFGAINGYPLECPRIEANQIDNIDEWFPISISNRFDLAPADGAHCGQQRIVLANNTQGRMFTIFEAQIPNPSPECGLDACRPLVEFWANMNEVEDPIARRWELIRAFFIGHPDLEAAGFGPFVNADLYSFGTGQVRTNNFDQFPWTLREFKLVEHSFFGIVPRVGVVQVPVADSPVGDHFNDALETPLGPECRESFLDAMEGLLTDEPDAMSFPISAECRAAESRDDFVSDYALQLAIGTGDFESEMQTRLDDLGSALTPTDIANRARFAGACIGCHQQSNGADLGNGVTAPNSAGFTHTMEFTTESCGDGQQCFPISDALTNSFLPHRAQVMEEFLAGTPCEGPVCQPAAGSGPLAPQDVPQILRPGGELDIDAMLMLERQGRRTGAQRTIGGRSTLATH